MSLADKQAEIKAAAILHAENFYHYKLIARACGVSHDTLQRYKAEDEQFASQLEQGRARFLNKNIKKAKPEFLLERLEPEMFKQRTEQDTNITGELKIETVDYSSANDTDTPSV